MGDLISGPIAATVISLAMTFGAQPEPTSPARANTVLIESTDGRICSGAIVSDNAVVTAAHCYDRLTSYRIRFVSPDLNGIQRTSDTDQVRIVKHVSVTPERALEDEKRRLYKRNMEIQGQDSSHLSVMSSSDDIALMFFDGGLPQGPNGADFKPLPLLKDRLKIYTDESLLVAGFGLDESNSVGQMREGLFVFKDVLVENYKHAYLKLRRAGPSQICDGDSGGPAYIFTDPDGDGSADWYIAGVTSGLTEPTESSSEACQTRDEFYSTSVADYSDWLAKELVNPQPLPGENKLPVEARISHLTE